MTEALRRALEAQTDSLDGYEDLQIVFLDMLWKAARGDWHGVSEGANDLRELEAKRCAGSRTCG